VITVDEVRSRIGQEVGVSAWKTITQEMIDAFAGLTDDQQWIHVDVERARRESPFAAPVAHGFLTVSLLSAMTREALEVDGDYRLRVNYGFNRLRFPAPVTAGSRIRAHVAPAAVKDVEGGVEIAWNITVEIDGAPKPALAAEWLTRMYR
jgi:acyl dehydratase